METVAVPLNYYLILSAVLFTIGVTGVLIKRNPIVIFMCIELMLNAVNLTLVAFSRYHQNLSGQLIVIGGLMQTTHTAQTYAIPGVGSIPLIGNLFKSQQKTDIHSELVILLRPIVIENDSQWDSLTGEPSDAPPMADLKSRQSAH